MTLKNLLYKFSLGLTLENADNPGKKYTIDSTGNNIIDETGEIVPFATLEELSKSTWEEVQKGIRLYSFLELLPLMLNQKKRFSFVSTNEQFSLIDNKILYSNGSPLALNFDITEKLFKEVI